MLTLAILISFIANLVSGGGQFVILQSPKSCEFSGSDQIDAHVIPEVFSACLGFTVRKGSNWPGLTIRNPFQLAENIVVVAIEGSSSVGDFKKLPQYPIYPNQDESKSWRILQDEVLERFPTIDSKNIQRIELGAEVSEIKSYQTTHLDRLNLEDAYFLQDLEELKSFTDSYKSEAKSEGEPKITWIVLNSFHTLVDFRGENSEAALEAKQLAREALVKLGKTVQEATHGKSLVAVVVSDVQHTRHTRATAENNSTMPGKRATKYSESYPAIFNIILWFVVAFIFALIATSYFIATMDPGRDSIIYRMTSNRMKKDS